MIVFFSLLQAILAFNLPLWWNNLQMASHPEQYHGNGIKTDFFEGIFTSQPKGWYYKQVFNNSSMIFIPGIFKHPTDSHCFVMCITALKPWQVLYYKYPAEEFAVTQDPNQFGYSIKIENSIFTHDNLTLDLDASKLYRPSSREFDEFYKTQLQDRIRLHGNQVPVKFNTLENVDVSIKGSIEFSEIVRLPTSPLNPNIMGPFTFLPFLPTYHGIISLSHKIHGSLSLQTRDGTNDIDLDGDGYVEKDHGSYFPKSYVWLHTMTWQNPSSRGSSLLFSAARVPVVGGLMTTAFLCVFYDAQTKRTHNFGTYTGAELAGLTFTMEGFLFVDPRYYNTLIKGNVQVMNVVLKVLSKTLKITARRDFTKSIPVFGPDFAKGMELLIEEALEGEVTVELIVRGQRAFLDQGYLAGMEINGPMEAMIQK